MESVLNFMYHGEVNVAQDDLNSFLAVAEELRVKGMLFYLEWSRTDTWLLVLGLTQSTSGGSDSSNASTLPTKSSSLPSRRRPSEDPHQAPSSNAPPSYSSPSAPPIKRPRPPPPAPRAPAPVQQAVEEDDEIQEYVPVKSEPAAQQQELYEDPSQGAAAGGSYQWR